MSNKSMPWMGKLKYFAKREKSAEGWSEMSPVNRDWEDVYRRRWQHDADSQYSSNAAACDFLYPMVVHECSSPMLIVVSLLDRPF